MTTTSSGSLPLRLSITVRGDCQFGSRRSPHLNLSPDSFCRLPLLKDPSQHPKIIEYPTARLEVRFKLFQVVPNQTQRFDPAGTHRFCTPLNVRLNRLMCLSNHLRQ